MLPISLGVKTKDLTVVHKVLQPTTTTTPPGPPLPPLSPSLPQPHRHRLLTFPRTTQARSHPRAFALAPPESHMVPFPPPQPGGSVSQRSPGWVQVSALPPTSYVIWGHHVTFVSSSVKWAFKKYVFHGTSVEIQRTGVRTVVGTEFSMSWVL